VIFPRGAISLAPRRFNLAVIASLAMTGSMI
jgi:hypothetical protein